MTNQLLLLLHTGRARFYNAIDIIILLLTPAFLCIAVPDWIFTPSSIDPYVYLGYMRNFSHYVTVFGGTYYATRLPYIVPGYICYKIFPPLMANYVLHLGFYYLALFSLYFILRITVNSRAALLTAVFMGFYPYFMSAMGWDYIDGAGIAYFLLTVLLLTLAAKSPQATQIPDPKQRSRPALSRKCGILLLLAGMSFAALIYTNTFLLIMTPSLIIYYLVMRPQSWNILLKSAFVAGSGMIIVTILLGIVNVAAGGMFLFFTPSFRAALHLLISSNPWIASGYTWLLHAPFMVFPLFIFLTSLLFIIVSLMHVKSGLSTMNSLLQVARENIFSLCHLLNFSFMLIMQLLGKPVFQLQYYASYLLPTAFLGAGAQLAAALSRPSKSQYIVLTVITISLLTGSYLINYHTSFCSVISCADSIWYVFAVLVAGALCLSMAGKHRQTINTLLISLAFLFFASANITPIIAHQITYCACEQRQQNFLAIIKSDDIIRNYDTTGDLFFWYSASEPLGDLYMSIAATHLWGHRLINDKFPEIAELDYLGQELEAATIIIPPGTDIVILSSDKDALFKANAALNRLGLQANLIGMEEISQGHISFTMTFIRSEMRNL
jgi:hypothetical protein